MMQVNVITTLLYRALHTRLLFRTIQDAQKHLTDIQIQTVHVVAACTIAAFALVL